MAMTTMRNTQTFPDSVPLLDDPVALRQRASEEGCLFFKGLIEPDAILNVRHQVLTICRKHGWLDESSPMEDGVVKAGMSVIEGGDKRWQEFYCDILKLHDFHALSLHPSIMAMFEKLFAGKVLPHPRNICRAMFPESRAYSTPPHQDHFYIGGSEDTWTNWMPLGDCPVELGSLAVAPGTHRAGMFAVHKAQGAGGHGVDVEDDRPWYTGDIMCGDVLILHSHTVHQGRDNLSGNRLRLSVDYRYQPASDPVRSDSLLPHMGWVTWEEIYAGWDEDDPMKYYWEDWGLKVVDREPR
mgnify:CR=1 FL=1